MTEPLRTPELVESDILAPAMDADEALRIDLICRRLAGATVEESVLHLPIKTPPPAPLAWLDRHRQPFQPLTMAVMDEFIENMDKYGDTYGAYYEWAMAPSPPSTPWWRRTIWFTEPTEWSP